MQTILGILSLISGPGIFLIGIKISAINLQKMAGGKVGAMLKKLSASRLAGLGIGAGAGVILESSSATTVILLGLVDAGIVTLMQATLIIMGSNIGTTFSVLLFSLNSLPIGGIFTTFTAIGIGVVMGTKGEKARAIGWIISAIGMIFLGLDVMNGGVVQMKTSDRFITLTNGMTNPLLLVAVGVLFTAVLQSGSATTGVAITLCGAGMMPLISAFYIIIGSNVGSCVTALIGSLGTGVNAKRTAVINLIFNTAGALVFMPILICFGDGIVDFLNAGFSSTVSIVYFHIAFNAITAGVLLPFVNQIVSLAKWLIPENGNKKTRLKAVFNSSKKLSLIRARLFSSRNS